ncbi:uncharacterized protein LOC126669656 [Mercurialis annua]|uniref:uncharacterized protein LOC126669656 n=1 Tax=Mercurialis annua TaxID=3986 RepID=UPI00215F3012|nr:uncharacterized protein LOC126669656 [Mercurialis annua]
MGCFLGCFGISSKRKPRKPANRVQPGDHLRLGSYEPLDGIISANLDIKEKPVTADSESSKKSKEPLNYKIRKKVSFNLNVQSYEPIPKVEEDEEESRNHFWENDYDEKKQKISQENAEDSSITAKMASYPSNYRYRNCNESFDDSFDEEDEISDMDDEDYDDDAIDLDDDEGSSGDIDNLRVTQDEFSGKFNYLPLSSEMRKSEDLSPFDDDLKSVGMNGRARNRSCYVSPVLNPVINLSQWKAVKAKGISQVNRQRKENVAPEIAVDASLSNWIISTDSCQSKTSSNTESSTENVSSKNGFFLHKTLL